jgi:glycosyltransferase involved in cell wall biosynthesis
VELEKSITFVVLTYNHAGYALEHLESIAHLVRKFDQTERHDLVISDDASQDTTVLEVSRWLEENRNLFRNVTTYFGSVNVGTCKSFLRATENIRTGYVKATGGDDLFSEEDIFSEICRLGDADIIGSQPLVLIGDVLYRFEKSSVIYALANAVYADRPFRDQLIGHGSIFTPGLIYSATLISDKRVRDFVSSCVLVEDLPSWIAISEYYPTVQYQVSKAHLVYYRRTLGSAYLIAKSPVFVDSLRCRQYLLDTETRPFSRLLIRNRIWRMTRCPPRLKSFCDFGRLVFSLKLMMHLPSAINNVRLLFVSLGKHKRHYNRIKGNVARLRSGEQ